MKNNKSAILIAGVLAFVSCCNQPKHAEKEVIDNNGAAESCQMDSATIDNLPLNGDRTCGGYSEDREPDMDEYLFFREVTDKVEGMSFTPLTVQTQVVAGINYKFYCRFCDGSEEYSPGHCYLTIFKPLPGRGEPVITSIEKLK